jgi:hypothetical protein
MVELLNGFPGFSHKNLFLLPWDLLQQGCGRMNFPAS